MLYVRTSLAFATLLACAACSEGEPSTSGGTGGGSAAGNASTGPSAGQKPGVPSTGPAAPEGSEPPTTPVSCSGQPGELYALSVTKLGGVEQLPLCTLKGKVALIVNGASGCGYTPQYAPLQALYAKYKGQQKPFEVLAFPSGSFNQEKATDTEVSAVCSTKYQITFPLLTIGPVIDNAAKGEVAQPVYQWLRQQPNMAAAVSWNFEKFLISKEGKAVARWASSVSPTDGGAIDQAIAAELAK